MKRDEKDTVEPKKYVKPTTSFRVQQAPTTRELKSYVVKCVYTSRIKVTGPSGKQYNFTPGAIQTVNAADYQHLLSLQRPAGSACCGGTAEARRYFEAV